MAPVPALPSNHQYYDPSTYSNASTYVITHIDINWFVDFKRKVLSGNVILSLKKNDGGQQLILDTKHLSIFKVSLISANKESDLVFRQSNGDNIFGAPLVIDLPDEFSLDVYKIKITYQTSPDASALQWLTANQTQGKKNPYVFSQCQAIHCRSILPCQDSPAVKQTYTAIVHTSDKLQALMSAVLKEKLSEDTYVFEQIVPVSSYLIAIAVGNLESRKLSDRSCVWCEPEGLDSAAYEFVDVEKMLKTAESIMGPYIWKRYDLLVLPPSFPYGGMENPCLTFVTPTIVAGDRSLVNVIAHEITHSWSGNLFTNKNWEHFWLNEGHTRFIEGKIVTKLNGEKYGDFFNQNGYNALIDQINTFGETHPYTKLVLDLNNVDPDDSYSIVPYEKGSALLQYIEQNYLGVELMEKFLRALVEHYKYKALDSQEYVDFLKLYLSKVNVNALEKLNREFNWEEWFYKPALPAYYKPHFPSDLNCTVNALIDHWSDESYKASEDDIKSLLPLQVEAFLDNMIRKAPLSDSTMDKMQTSYAFQKCKNYEIKFRWLLLCAKSRYRPQLSSCLNFIQTVGRMKYLKPIYSALAEWPEAKTKAIETYTQNMDYMHSVSATVVGRILNT